MIEESLQAVLCEPARVTHLVAPDEEDGNDFSEDAEEPEEPPEGGLITVGPKADTQFGTTLEDDFDSGITAVRKRLMASATADRAMTAPPIPSATRSSNV